MIREKMAFVNMKFVEGNPSEHGSWVYSAALNVECVELKITLTLLQ